MSEEIPRRGKVIGSMQIDELPEHLRQIASQIDQATFNTKLKLTAGMVVASAPGVAASLGSRSMREALIAVPVSLAAAGFGMFIGHGLGKTAKERLELQLQLGKELGQQRQHKLITGFLAQGATHIVVPGDNRVHFLMGPDDKEGQAFRPLLRARRVPITEE